METPPHLVENPSPRRPTGTVTFLFSDIEGSTRLWENYPGAMAVAHRRQEVIIRQAMAAHDGYVYKMIGDAFQVAFSSAPAALLAALDAQRALQAEAWGEIGRLKVRMALHTCVTEERSDDYLGPGLNRVARIMSAGHGEQVLLSQAVTELVQNHLPTEVSLLDLDEHYLKDLLHPEHLYQLAAPGLASSFPALKTSAPLSNLPVQNTPFIGRQSELAQIETMLNDPECRLISLVGIGGSGKTRLSIQVAAQNQAFHGHTHFARLEAINSPEDLISEIAKTVKYPFRSPPGGGLPLIEAQDQLLNYLADKRLLLVLDNFEQLAGCAAILTEMLQAAPSIKLLVTSRERLNLPEEWVLEIAGLPFPDRQECEAVSQYAAVQMFIRVAERSGHFTASADDEPAIAQICQLLEGMPLGIEIAAAWTKMLSCAEIAAEIERSLDFLTVTWRGMPERHQTLRMVFDYSWRLLNKVEQTAFCKLAVFQSGFSRAAAQEVADASLSLLTALSDKSFVRRITSGRFDIHPVLKAYAAEKLAAQENVLAEVRSHHAAYFSRWLCCMFDDLKGSEQQSALAALRAETQNLRLARQTLLEQCDLQSLEQMMPAMLLFDVMNDQRVETQEMLYWLFALERLLRTQEITPTHQGLLAITLAALHRLTQNRPNLGQNAHHYQQESIQLAEALPDNQTKALTILLNCVGGGLAPQYAYDLCQRSIVFFQQAHDPWGVALSQLIQGDTASFGNLDYELARQAYRASQEAFASIQSLWGLALCCTGLTFLEYKTGHLEQAHRMGQEGLDMLIRLGNFERLLEIRHILGEIAMKIGKLAEARQYFRGNLAYSLQVGDQPRTAYYTERLAHMV